MNNGNVNNDNKNNNNYVWPVRAGEWTPRVPYEPARLSSLAPKGAPAAPTTLFTDLYKSWRRCRRLKRNTVNALKFEYRAELNLLELARELESDTYCPARVIRFAVNRPKLREIVAADFRDRIVHHYLVERLERLYEPVFIHDSYACRVGKGVHKAVARVRDFIRSGTANGALPFYALHLDVKNFFMTIDKRLLAAMIEERLVKEARKVNHPSPQPSPTEGRGGTCRTPLLGMYANVSKNAPDFLPPLQGESRGGDGVDGELPFLNHLTKLILRHEPMAARLDKGDQRHLASVPPHKSLLYAPPGVGLPIGNLTSQFFANVYLNELDQYCKHTLKCRYYVRYCDDFLILDRDPQRLLTIQEEVSRFLRERLRLELNSRYAAIREVQNGIDFIGYIIRPDYVLVRRRSINNLRARLAAFARTAVRQKGSSGEPLYAVTPTAPQLERLRGVLASYYGHFKWADSHRLRRSLFVRYPWLHAFFRLDRQAMPKKRTVNT